MTAKPAGHPSEPPDENALDLCRRAPTVPELAHRLGMIVHDLTQSAEALRLSMQITDEPDPQALISFSLSAGAAAGWMMLLAATMAGLRAEAQSRGGEREAGRKGEKGRGSSVPLSPVPPEIAHMDMSEVMHGGPQMDPHPNEISSRGASPRRKTPRRKPPEQTAGAGTDLSQAAAPPAKRRVRG